MGTYNGRPYTQKEIADRIIGIIPSAYQSNEDGSVHIPSLNLVIIISIWRPNQYDRFSLCYSDGKEFKILIDNAAIVRTEWPGDYIASYCLAEIIEKWTGKYLPEDMDGNLPKLVGFFQNKILRDENAYLYMR